MVCPKCGNENPQAAKFCLECGRRLAKTCPRCHASLPPEARFCFECGAPVAATETGQAGRDSKLTEVMQRLAPPEFTARLRAAQGQAGNERRMVTMLFSDVKGSTALATELDPEEMLELLNGAFEFLIEPVYRYEGTLAHILGDAILAFFGAPIAHEDDPERACRAALEMIAGAQQYAARLARERGIRGFNVRVGINTGLVVLGELGSDLRMEYTAVGDAINLAARMEQNAPAGGILISHDTYRHVRGLFEMTAQPPLVVKGFANPVQTYLLQRARPRAFRIATRGIEGVETRMVGRDAEFLILQNAFRDAVEEARTRIVTIVGEAGVGKSRLIYEFDNWIQLRPEEVYRFKGRATAGALAAPYGVIRDIFTNRFDILESDSAAAALAKFRAGMAGILEPDKADLVGQMVGFDFAAAGSAAVQALLGNPSFNQLATAYMAQFARAIVRRQPALLLLEDLHWADDSSLDLIWRLATELPAAPLLIVAVTRPTLFERRPNWGEGQEAHVRLELRSLSRRACLELVEEILQRAPHVPAELRDLIVEGAEGNPFYVEELIKMLIEDRVIVTGAGQWSVALDRLAQVRVPPTLTGILQARLDALPAGEKALLQRAAVVGRLFWDDTVRALSAGNAAWGEGETNVFRATLDTLRNRELVFRRERSAFAGTVEHAFKHSLLRDVIYETVLLKLRRKYHSQVAGWLEAHAGERLSEFLRPIAGHYELAGEGLKAAGYLRRAGEKAVKVSAYRDAQADFERALRLLPSPPASLPSVGEGGLRPSPPAPLPHVGEGSEVRAAALVGLGLTLLRLSDYPAAAARLEEGLALAQAAGERQIEAAALTALGETGWRQGAYDAAEQRLAAGLAAAQACGDQAGMALAAHQLGWVAYRRGQHAQAGRWAEESRTWYSEIGDRQGIAAALNELGIIAFGQNEPAAAQRHFTASLTLCQAIGDRRGTANALNNLGMAASRQGAWEEERAYYEQCRGIYEEIGERAGVVIALLNLGELCVDQGLDAEAWTYLRAALREAVAIHTPLNVLYVLIQAARLRYRAGASERAAELLGLVLHHPASDSGIAQESAIETALAGLRQALPAAQLEAALACGAGLDLAQVVAEIMVE